MTKYIFGFIAVAHGWMAHSKLDDAQYWDAGIGMLLGLAVMWLAVNWEQR